MRPIGIIAPVLIIAPKPVGAIAHFALISRPEKGSYGRDTAISNQQP